MAAIPADSGGVEKGLGVFEIGIEVQQGREIEGLRIENPFV